MAKAGVPTTDRSTIPENGRAAPAPELRCLSPVGLSSLLTCLCWRFLGRRRLLRGSIRVEDARDSDRVASVLIRKDTGVGIPRPSLGQEIGSLLQRFSILDLLPGIGGIAPDDRAHGRAGSVVGVVDCLTAANAGVEMIVLGLIWVGGTSLRGTVAPERLAIVIPDLRTSCLKVEDGCRALNLFAHLVEATRLVTALGMDFHAVRVGEFNCMVIVDFTILVAGADFSPTHPLG